MLALLGSKQLVSVVELQDVVGDPDVDVAASGCLAEADLLPVHAHDTDRGGTARDPIAVAAAAVGAGKPGALGAFLATHPGAKRFVEAPKPIPTSFAREAFFAVTSFQFTNAQGVSRHGRFRIRPEEGVEYLSNEQAAAKSPDFLFKEIGPRLASKPARLGVFVQMAGDGDDVTDSTVAWPESRPEIPFGAITLTERVDDTEPQRRKIIFDPIPRVDGIDPSGDPLTEVRSDIYLLSGRRRRASAEK